MPDHNRSPDLIPAHGGYRDLKSYQMSEIIYDATIVFCDRFINRRSRPHDQMVQAARSGKQNIAEGSMASGASKKTELKLMGVARASLEELLLDYQDYLRQNNLPLWGKDHPKARKVRGLCYRSDRSYSTYKTCIEAAPPRNRRPTRQSYMGTWYLVGFCRLHSHPRVFQAGRIVDIEIEPAGFDARQFNPDTCLESAFGIFKGNDTFTVKLRFNAFISRFVRNEIWHGLQEITENQDEGSEIWLPCGGTGAGRTQERGGRRGKKTRKIALHVIFSTQGHYMNYGQ